MNTYRRGPLRLWETVLMVRAAGGPIGTSRVAGEPRGSFVTALMLGALLCLGAISAAWMRRDPSVIDRFELVAYILAPVAMMWMVTFEFRRHRALAFLQVIPRTFPPRALLLPPTCALGAVIALASLTILPCLAAIALFGCWCCATCVGHWFAGRSNALIGLVGLPLAYAPILAIGSCASGSWFTAAAVALGLALVACLMPVRADFLAGVRTHAGEPSRMAAAASDAAALPAQRERGNTLVRRAPPWARHWTMFQLFGVTVRAQAGWTALPVLLPISLALVWIDPIRAARFGLSFAMIMATRFSTTHTLAVREFLQVRPIARRPAFQGLVLPWLLLTLVNPTATMVRVMTVHDLPRDAIAYAAQPAPANTKSRAQAGAANERRKQDARSLVVTREVRQQLAVEVLKFGLLQLTLFFALSVLGAVDKPSMRWNRSEWLKLLVMLPLHVFAWPLVLPTLAREVPWGPPPVWLGMLLVAVGAFALRRRLALPR